jgi:hypothetical protein
MGMTLEAFQAALPNLVARGFPKPAPDTHNFDLSRDSIWRQMRDHVTEDDKAVDVGGRPVAAPLVLQGGREPSPVTPPIESKTSLSRPASAATTQRRNASPDPIAARFLARNVAIRHRINSLTYKLPPRPALTRAKFSRCRRHRSDGPCIDMLFSMSASHEEVIPMGSNYLNK